MILVCLFRRPVTAQPREGLGTFGAPQGIVQAGIEHSEFMDSCPSNDNVPEAALCAACSREGYARTSFRPK